MESMPGKVVGIWKQHRKLWIVIMTTVLVVASLFSIIHFSKPALTALPWFRAQSQNSSTADLDKGDLLIESGQYSQAVDVFSHAISQDGDLAKAYAGRGNGYLGLRRFDAAIADFTISLKYARSANVLSARCNAYRIVKKYEMAQSDCEAAIALDPKNSESHIELGVLFLDLGRYAQARNEIEAALQIDPSSAKAYYALSQLELEQGHSSLALAALSKCIVLEPMKARWYWERGVIYFSQGEIDLTGKDMQAVLKYGNPDIDGELMLEAGTIMREIGKSP